MRSAEPMPHSPTTRAQNGSPLDATAAPSAAGPRWACLRDRRFVVFCALAGMNMLAYNQLYFAVPVELSRRGLDLPRGAALQALADRLWALHTNEYDYLANKKHTSEAELRK